VIDIIYIDDESETERFRMKLELLELRGYRTHTVARVDDAQSTLDKHKGSVRAILLDILMPPLGRYTLAETDDGTSTGLVLLREIRGVLPDVPIILVSVKPRSEAAEAVTKYGVTAYIQRPATGLQIADVLDQVLREGAR
jgi:CheY-like chemotaxis protein